MEALAVVDRFETKYPYIRQFGDPKFNVSDFSKQVLAYNGEKEIKQTQSQLKDAHNYLQKEIGGYLYDNYSCFMKTSESLKTANHEFEELKTMLN